MRERLGGFLVALAQVYFALLFAWAILHGLFGDRWALLFLFNTFSAYLFLPLILVFPIALVIRRREIWIGLVAAVVLATFLFGGLFIPKPLSSEKGKTLTVMSYNILGTNRQTDAIVATIRAANADVIGIQELNDPVADSIRTDLAKEYPYQVLHPQYGVAGLGVISRYPLRAINATLPGEWVGTPQLLAMDWENTTLIVLNVHPIPTMSFPTDYVLVPLQVEQSISQRESDIQALANFVMARQEPLIVLGDFNLTDQNAGYAIIANVLTDSWREAGWAFGTTWPSPFPSGNSRIVIMGIPFSSWLLRIDYIFHSGHWRTVSAHVGAWDGFSDHRPVIAQLRLK